MKLGVRPQSLLRPLLAGQESVARLINTINSSSFSYGKLISNMLCGINIHLQPGVHLTRFYVSTGR